jgi:hypothetical protein
MNHTHPLAAIFTLTVFKFAPLASRFRFRLICLTPTHQYYPGFTAIDVILLPTFFPAFPAVNETIVFTPSAAAGTQPSLSVAF